MQVSSDHSLKLVLNVSLIAALCLIKMFFVSCRCYCFYSIYLDYLCQWLQLQSLRKKRSHPRICLGFMLLCLQFLCIICLYFPPVFLSPLSYLIYSFWCFPFSFFQPSVWKSNCFFISHWSNNKNRLALNYAASKYQAIKPTRNTLKSRLLCFGCIMHNVRSVIGPCKAHLDVVVVHAKVMNTIRKLLS